MAILYGHFPEIIFFVKDRRHDSGIQAYVPAQVELVGHEIQVALILRLPGIMLLPVPLLK